MVVDFGRVRCLLASCWLGCCSRVRRGRGSCWLFELVVNEIAFHSIPFRVVFRCGKESHVTREVVVVSVGSVRLQGGVEVVLPFHWTLLLVCGDLFA